MAIREELFLDLSRAQQAVDDLERQLDSLLQPIQIPVEIDSRGALDELRRDIRAADAQDIDVDVDVADIDRAEREMTELRREVDQTGDEFTQLRRKADDSADAVLRVGTRGASVFTNLRGSILGVAAGFGLIQAARGFITFATGAISAASDLEESLSKTQVVFGDFTTDIESFARTAPQALGLSTSAALEMTATFGNLFTALGLTREAAADLSPEIVQLGSDLASFNNIPVEDALTALRSGLVGEVEPLRRLGVALNAASVEAKALELGLVGAGGEISEAAKVQARYALILEQTTNAQGDFARTSDGIANRQRTLRAEFANVSAQIGEALLPAYEGLLTLAPAVIDFFENLEPVIRDLSVAFKDATEGGEDFLLFLSRLPGAGITLGNVIGDLVGGFIDLRQAGVDAVTGQGLDAALVNAADAGEKFASVFEELDFNAIRNGLVRVLQSGVDPARALNAALTQLADTSFELDDLSDVAASLAEISGVKSGDLIKLMREIEKFGPALGFDPDEIDAVVRGLDRLLIRPSDDTLREELDSIRNFGSAIPQITSDILTEAEALDRLADAAVGAGVSLGDIFAAPSQFPELAEEIALVPEATRGLSTAVDDFFEFATGFRETNQNLAEQIDIFSKLPDEIELSKEEFLANLRISAAEKREFDANLIALFAISPELASAIARGGIGLRGLLSDIIADPAAIAEAEALIIGSATDLSTTFSQEFFDRLADADLNDIIAFLSQLSDPAALDAAIGVLIADINDRLLGAGLTAPILLTPELAFIPSVSGPQFQGPATRPAPPNTFNFVFNNPVTRDLQSDADRAAQEIGSVITSRLLQ